MEVNFDGLVGQTHNYGGLSFGNVASARSKYKRSNPRLAALEGLKKMKFLADRGIPQAVLPPHERPAFFALAALGFKGDEASLLKTLPDQLLSWHGSASAMWTANAATVSPSADTADGKLHITPANLQTYYHRVLEVETTTNVLRAIFEAPEHFCVHEALPASPCFADEGAANHSRLCDKEKPGIELFVYGVAPGLSKVKPKRFPARQTLQASQAIARRHQLDLTHTFFVQQHPKAIDAGCFHNDVISVAHENVLLYHEEAYLEGEKVIEELSSAYLKLYGKPLVAVKVPKESLSYKEAVRSYLFNSQLISLPNGRMMILSPEECREQQHARLCLEAILKGKSNPIDEWVSIDLRQSMRNGGGPACLRLRVVLTEKERQAIKARVFLDEGLYRDLVAWVERHYRTDFHPDDLRDPSLIVEIREALDELTRILRLGSIYPFQRV